MGRGEGVSVLQLIDAVERVTGRSIARVIGPRRAGDVSALYADGSWIGAHSGMVGYADLDTICADAWRWQSGNPSGYRACC